MHFLFLISSSSSFIISVTRDKKQEMQDFFDIAESLGGYETGEPHLFTTEKELNDYVNEEYDMSLPKLLSTDDYGYYKDTYGAILDNIKEGKICLMQDISYGQEELYRKLLNYVLKKYDLKNNF